MVDYFVLVKDKSVAIEFDIPDQKEPNVSIYPNPNNGTFRVACEHFKHDVEIAVFNSLGVVVFREQYREYQSGEISIGEHQPGLYVVMITDGTGNTTRKMLITE